MNRAGEGVPSDYHEAERWYWRAAEQYRAKAEQGDDDAQWIIGRLYEEGDGVPQDSTEALHWYRRAAERGHGRAQVDLGLLYQDGEGVLTDYVAAYAWFSVVAANPRDGIGVLLGSSLRDDLADRMTADQIADGQRLARKLWDRIETESER